MISAAEVSQLNGFGVVVPVRAQAVMASMSSGTLEKTPRRRRLSVSDLDANQQVVAAPVDDPHYVLIDLEFVTLEAARGFRQFLETQVWSTQANSPALVGSPRARIAEVAPAG
jgi:hypothetical protein